MIDSPPGSESSVRLRERVAQLEAILPFIRQNITESLNGLRSQYDDQANQVNRQLTDLKVQVADLNLQVNDLRTLVSRQPTQQEDTRLWRVVVGIGIFIALIAVLMAAIWVRIGQIPGIAT